MSIRDRLDARRERRILASLPPVPVPNDGDEDRSPEYCHRHGMRCGSQH